MVRLEKVNKYFFRRRRNEIHVINNTSMELSGKGLVALLGPSGCGKTTLLNVIGGLDKVNRGKIFVNGQRITRRRTGKIDKIRTLNIGYIFQNYNLVEDMTVFDNVALALKMVGITDKKEIEDKVRYVLEKVGMIRYRNRYVNMLSGGERQRVGIARAIVKNPTIIIADEPTGNLDSRNTLEVMNIIRTIAEEKLVILVTHEEKLAQFYATRIIRIRDGSIISDEINEHADDLDYRVENKVYLKDIKDHKRLDTGEYIVNFYNDDKEKLNLDIVLKSGNIYIRTNLPNDHIEIVDEASGIELIDDHYRSMTREEMQANAFDLSRLATDKKRKYKSILNPWTLIKQGFKTIGSYNLLKKVLLIGFVISAMFITYALSTVFGVLNVTDDKFSTADRDYLTVIGKKISVDTYLEYEQSPDNLYVMPGDSTITLEMKFNDFIQTMGFSAYLTGSLSDVDKLSESDLTCGRLSENNREIVVDRMVLKSVIKEQFSVEVGAGKPKDFLGRTMHVKNMGDFTLVGVCNLQTPCIYAPKSQFINLLANTTSSEDEMYFDEEFEENGTIDFIDYKLMQDDITLKKGTWPKNDYEVLVSYQHKDEKSHKIGKELKKKINGHKLKVVGWYTDEKNSDLLLVNREMIKYALVKKKDNVTLCPVDKASSLETLKAEGINVKDTYVNSRDKYIKERWASMLSMLVVAGIILMISFIEIFLMIRASFISRIKEVGVYRAIGVKKRDIYRMFTGEILAITTIASMPGFIFMTFIITKLSKITYLSDMFLINIQLMILCVVVIYGLNLIFGLLPVWRTIRHRPARILARTDIN